ncbi:MAG: zinc ABC transporter substrate-binding protein [Oxalobacter sp.]|nr:zinc ABC transporter substrate-binding protein [Oxalobacter sp.]
MKKILRLLFVAVCAISFICACSSNTDKTGKTVKKVRIVSTIYPAYDWVNQIIGKDNPNIQSSLLATNGVDLHSYQPTAQDIASISQADIVITVGGSSDRWVKDTIDRLSGKKPTLVALMDIPGMTLLKEGHVGEDHHGHEHHVAHHHDGGTYDEHVWLSLTNAITSVKAIEKTVIDIDRVGAKTYSNNAADYVGKLKALDKDYRNTIARSPGRTLVFADRFPFRYLANDYELIAIAAFDGCSTETRASFETIRRLASALDSHALDAVVILEESDGKIAQSVLSASKQPGRKVLVMNAMQSVRPGQKKGYLETMGENLAVLTQALIKKTGLPE